MEWLLYQEFCSDASQMTQRENEWLYSYRNICRFDKGLQVKATAPRDERGVEGAPPDALFTGPL